MPDILAPGFNCTKIRGSACLELDELGLGRGLTGTLPVLEGKWRLPRLLILWLGRKQGLALQRHISTDTQEDKSDIQMLAGQNSPAAARTAARGTAAAAAADEEERNLFGVAGAAEAQNAAKRVV